jgi:sulfite exporter TauE/SafE
MENKKSSFNKYLLFILAASIFLIGFLMFKLNGIQNPSSAIVTVPAVPTGINLWAVFLTGLFVGGLSCLAVQGGLLAATIAQNEEEKLKENTKKTGNALPILAFLSTKLIAYTIFGFLLGLLGSVVQLSLTFKVIMQFAVVIFMLGTAFNILNVHPVFRYFVIQPPKFLTRLVRNQSKSKSIFAPAFLGALTVFIPCGTTQAMMVLSIGSGNPFLGAAVLFAFVLGTSPLFFILGYFATKLSDKLHRSFMKIAAVALIILALFNLNSALRLTGSKFTTDSIWKFFATSTKAQENGKSLNAVSEVTITLDDKGYFPKSFVVNKGSYVTMHLVNSGGRGCIQGFTIPKFGIQKVVPFGTSGTISFLAPKETGEIAFMCSMGMYRGTIEVI